MIRTFEYTNRRRRFSLVGKPLCGLLLCLFTLTLAGCPTSTSDPAKKVAALDGEAIYELPAFKKANDDLKAWAEKRSEELKKEMEGKPDKEKANLQRQFQLDLQKQTNDAFTKLRQRADGAVAKVARDKGALVVLDKKIVVYGVPEITDDVKAAFGDKKEFSEADAITLPEEQDTSGAPVGYFDQTVVRALKVFQQADLDIANERRKLIEAMQTELGDKPKPSDVQQMQKALQLRLEAFTEQKMAPLVKAVNDSVEEVAKAEGLSLVLDKQHVMYGGRNMTEQVVETFLKKVGSIGDAPAEEGSPTPAATPKEGG